MGEAVASLLMLSLPERALDVARAFVMASGDRDQLITIKEIVAVAMAAASPSCPGDQAVAVASHFFVAHSELVCELSTLATTTAADSANLDASGAPCGTDACAVSIAARTALAAIVHVVHRVFSVTASLDVGVATAATVFVVKGYLPRSREVHLALHGGGVESANAASNAATEALLTAGGVHPTPSGAAAFHPALAADVLGVLIEYILPRGHPGATPCIVVVPGVGPSRRAAGTCCHNCTPRLCVSSRMLPYISVPPFCAFRVSYRPSVARSKCASFIDRSRDRRRASCVFARVQRAHRARCIRGHAVRHRSPPRDYGTRLRPPFPPSDLCAPPAGARFASASPSRSRYANTETADATSSAPSRSFWDSHHRAGIFSPLCVLGPVCLLSLAWGGVVGGRANLA